MKNNIHNPCRLYLLIAFIATGVIVVTLWKLTAINPLWLYLITINLINFCFYGYDKQKAIHQKSRIPELVLHFLALTGGSIGALAGQHIFHHKTKKLSFQLLFIFISVVQIGVIIWFVMRNAR